MKRRLFALPFHLFLATLVYGQVQSGRIEGTVQDSSGAVVPGARLSIVSVRTQVKVEVVADPQGYYVFPILQPGVYTISAEASGFRKATVSNIVLTVGVTLRQDVKLEVGALAETITVEASSVRVQTTEPTIQRAVTLRDIDTLPQLGRNPIALAVFQPGVQINPGDASFSRVNGMRQGSNNNTLDGIDVNDSVLPRLGLTLNSTNTDSVEEFRIITNGAKAEYGRNAGAQVELITRSGTNDFHGNLFEYHRNTVLNANNFFNNTSGQARPKLIQNQFGGSLGGPVTIPKILNGRDRLFFFFNYQESRVAQETVRLRTVLTPEAKRGLFRWKPPNSNDIRTFDILANDPRRIGIDRTVAGNLALLPDPNTTCSTCDDLNTAGFRFNSPTPAENDQFTTKVDFNLRPTHRLWYRHSRLRTLSWDALNNADPTFPGQPSGTQGGVRWGFAIGSSWTLAPWLVNEFIAGHQQASVDFFRLRALTGGIPLIGANLFTNPIPTGTGSRRNSPVNQITDNVSLLRGTHSVKVGIRYSLTTQFQSSDAGIWPTYALARASGKTPPSSIGPSGAATIATADRQRFENLYNDLLGRLSSTSTTFYSDLKTFQPAATPRVRNFKLPDYGLYFQDDWRVRSNFTVNIGVRWEFFGVPYERDNLEGEIEQNQAGLVHAANQIADLTVRPGSDWYRNDRNNFAPRVGFAWDPFRDGRTSIRASWGVFYDRVIGATANDIDSSTPGFSAPQQVFPNQSGTTDVRVGDRPPLPAAPATPPLILPPTRSQATLALFEPGFRAPYVFQMNFTIQREFFRNTVLEAGYVGNRGVKLLADLNWNQPRIFGSFLTDFNQIREFRRTGTPVPVSNVFVRLFGNVANAVSAIGGSVFDQGAVGSAANTVDTNNYTRYAGAGLSPYFLRNYPQFQNVVVGTNSGRNYYNSLQLSVRRQTGNLRFAANYTWSKTIDNVSTDGSGFAAPIDSYNFLLNRGRSDSDRPHTLNWMASYILPIGRGRLIAGGLPDWADRLLGGWEIGSLGLWTSGPVMTLSSGVATGPTGNATWGNYNGDRRFGEIRRTGGGVYYSSDAIIAQLRDPASIPGPGEFGTAGRNTFRGPRFFGTDLSLLKRFRVHGDRTFVTFRFEAYNLLNQTNFGTPGFNLQTPQALGQITNTVGNPRFMQLALRLDF